ncbi:TPA: hypothetical protein ACKPGA_001467 [Pseudomonas aeruginosa]|uniref:hypothetical protein n=1 Tax=Pseudomonas aeruginosa TaxID=287 RepID=UPI001E42AC48|nr:hypothetical protein [Pseudomonas aeruginosa]
MSDLLAVIGKKRSLVFDQRSYISQLLGIRTWCFLNTPLRPSDGCEAFLCLEPGEYPENIRMTIFALLGLLLRIPKCIWMWELGCYKININNLWYTLLWDARRSPSYLDWLKGRADNWNPSVRAHFKHLLGE